MIVAGHVGRNSLIWSNLSLPFIYSGRWWNPAAGSTSLHVGSNQQGSESSAQHYSRSAGLRFMRQYRECAGPVSRFHQRYWRALMRFNNSLSVYRAIRYTIGADSRWMKVSRYWIHQWIKELRSWWMSGTFSSSIIITIDSLNYLFTLAWNRIGSRFFIFTLLHHLHLSHTFYNNRHGRKE